MFIVGLVGKYNKPRHLMRSPATLLFFAIHIKELLSHFLALWGETFKMTLFILDETVSRYGETSISRASEDYPGKSHLTARSC